MSLTKRLGLIVGAATSLSSVAMAQSTLDSSRAFANELYSDSSGRASSLAGPAFTPKLGGYEQFRYTLNFRSDDGATLNAAQPATFSSNNSKLTNGFSNARTNINLSGNINSEDWGYYVEFLATDGGTGGFANVRDVYGTYKIGNGWDLKWGQFSAPYLKEALVSDTRQLAIDRSVFDGYFSGNRTQGAQITYSADSFRVMGSVNDGFNTQNTDYATTGLSSEADFGLTARGEWKWAGGWDQADQFTAWQNSQFFGVVGGAVHFQNGGSTTNTLKTNLFGFTADVLVKGNGWNAFAAFAIQHLGKNPASITGGSTSAQKTDDFGFLVQGGIFVAPQWELFARADVIKADKNWGTAPAVAGPPPTGDFKLDGTFFAVTAGANYYIVPDSQALKLTGEVEFFLNRPNGPAAAGGSTLNGLLASPQGKSSQVMIAAQMQVAF